MNRRWFARKNIILRGEGVQVEVASPAQFTRNGAQVAVIGDIAPLPTIVNETVRFGVGANFMVTGAYRVIPLDNTATPPSIDGMTPNSSEIDTTKKGTYIIKVQLNTLQPALVSIQMVVDGTIFQKTMTQVGNVAGGDRSAEAVFMISFPTDAPHLLQFSALGDTIPATGSVDYDATSQIYVTHSNSF